MFVLGGVASTPALENHDLQDLVLGLASDRASVEDSESERSMHLGNWSACIGILNSWGVCGALSGSGRFASEFSWSELVARVPPRSRPEDDSEFELPDS